MFVGFSYPTLTESSSIWLALKFMLDLGFVQEAVFLFDYFSMCVFFSVNLADKNKDISLKPVGLCLINEKT